MKYSDYFKREYEKLFPIMTVWLSSFFILLALAKDLFLVGFRWDWFLIRIAYPPAMYLNVILYRRSQFFNRHYELSSWFSALYVAIYATYFSFSTGHVQSSYSLAIVSVIGGLSVMPVTRFCFYGIVATSCAIFLGTNIHLSHPGVHEISASVMPYLPIASFFIAIYELFLAKRKREYRIQEKLAFHLKQQDEMIMRQSKTLADSQIDIQVGRIAAQVAHDIQSPLGIVLSSLDQLKNANPRVVHQAEGATLRLKAISEQLLSSRASYKSDEIVNIDLVPLIQQVVEEKRVYAALLKKTAKIEFEINQSPIYGLVNPLDFTRILCNVIKNSLEAIDSDGRIQVELDQQENDVELAVMDNGKGIPPAAIAKVFQRGFSFGKKDGHGLGLSHAKEVLETWGGKIGIEVRPEGGVTVLMKIQKTPERKSISLGSAEYVLVDDNPLTHVSWKGSAEKHNVRLITFLDPQHLNQQIDKISREARFYIDYKLGNGISGVSFAKAIKELGFNNVFIATGMRNAEILEARKIIPIVTKEPPWLAHAE